MSWASDGKSPAAWARRVPYLDDEVRRSRRENGLARMELGGIDAVRMAGKPLHQFA